MMGNTKEFQQLYAKWRDRIDIGANEFCDLPPKRKNELAILLWVAEFTANFPEGMIVQDEAPDFCLQGKRNVIGIEVTQFIDRELRKVEKKWDSILREANAFFMESCSDRVRVEVFLDKCQAKLPKGRIVKDIISRAISAYVIKNIPEDCQRRFDGKCNIRQKEIHVTINLSVSRIQQPEKYSNMWIPQWIGWGPTTEKIQKQLQKQIDEKNNKIDSYASKCDEVWLIIFNEGTAFSNGICVPAGIEDNASNYLFSKVLFCDFQNQRVYDLRQTAKTTSVI